jgi:hypothetical protein
VINGSIDNTDPTQTDKLVRSGIAQTCPPTTTCAIFGGEAQYHYDSYTFTNTSGSTQCVTIDTNTECNRALSIFIAAYLGSFDPNNICTNWIGDSGFSPDPDRAFQVEVADGQTFVVVVSEVTADAGCPDYTLTVTGLCGGGTPTPTPTATPTATATPTGSPSCTPIMINGSIDNSDPTQTDQLVHSGIAQTCPPTATCAIFGDPTPHHYDSYTFTNTTGSTQCFTIDTNTECTGINSIFVAAYLGSFDPNNICNHWIGDSGFSPDPDQAFQVNVPAGQTLVVVVSEVFNAGCPGYTVTVTGLCGGGTPTPTPTATPTASPGPRPTPTPRSAPTPRPRPTPAPRP